MSAVSLAARLGFDPPRLAFALRTALGACLALYLAWALGLEHPQWSAMTVWATSQPTRGQLLEKSLFRCIGTVAGTLAGVGLMWASGGQPLGLVLGLAAWIGLCAFWGNVLRGFVAYGSILAGYSAAMVALLDTAHPDHVLLLGADRLATVLVGVLTALVVGWLFTPALAEDTVLGRGRRLTARLLRAMADHLRGAPAGEHPHALLREMAAIEEMLDPHGAGSLRSRQAVRAVRRLLTAEVAAILWLKYPQAAQPVAAAALEEAAMALEATASPLEALRRAHQAADAPLREMLDRLEPALARPLEGGPGSGAARPSHPLVLHQDWVGARQALIRAVGAMLAVGALWVLTGWPGAPFMLLGIAVMTSLFSTMDNPALMMRFVARGQVIGVAGALACRWLAWPWAGDAQQLILMMMPFILLGAPLVAHRRTMPMSFDYNMVMLLLSQPHYPLEGSVLSSLAMGVAVVAGPLVALGFYRFVYPTDARRRMDVLIAMMVRELRDMAAPGATPSAELWRARLYHRLLRLVGWTEKTAEREISASDGGLAVLALGSAALRLQALARQELPPGCARAVATALRRMRQDPGAAGPALALAAARLERAGRAEAAVLDRAARAVAAQRAFFARAA
ncbi:FUSC family protein [Rhodovarius lipocyclicus]|uniref:FUSC family protein n=1 Tax=Rhodovarius lipocyclicus TaxID=268410 RepID=UPI001359D4D4|nr:FUSC family protein [Rhodovarius lipocyclicus]